MWGRVYLRRALTAGDGPQLCDGIMGFTH